MARPLDLPRRAGSRPRTSSQIPHGQLDQQPGDARHTDAILAAALAWPWVQPRPSAISADGARALTLDAAAGPDEAFLTGREFCHAHAQGDFSWHATLPVPLAAAGRAGWGRTPLPHAHRPGARDRRHALRPRDDFERDVILRLVRASYEFALTPNGQPAAEQTSICAKEQPCPSMS